MSKRLVKLSVNGREREDAISEHTLLLDYLREQLGLTGTKRGCDGGECGACTVLVDGKPQLSCITLACRCEGSQVSTIESLAQQGRLSALQTAFNEKLGTQCGFCTPGMMICARALLDRNPDPSEDEIREAISGQICRCTGYTTIVRSIQWAAEHANEEVQA